VKPAPAPVKQPVPAAGNPEDFVVRDGVLLEYRGAAGDVVIPQGVRVVAAQAFDKRRDVRRVYIPDGVKEIAGSAFFQCESLAYVRIPPSVEAIDRCAFASRFDPRYPLTGRTALPSLGEVEMSEAQWRKYYDLFPYTQQAKRIAQQKQWRERGLCQHCGGRIAFVGLQCKTCGRAKDY